MATIRYEGGSCDGLVVEDVPDVAESHPQRELSGDDREQPYELYRRRGVEEGVTVFEFDSRSATAVLTAGQEFRTDGS